jgi:hypothetical protein
MSQKTAFSLKSCFAAHTSARGVAFRRRGEGSSSRCCGVYTFDAYDNLAGERIYYDRGTVLRQLGVFYEPQTVLGQISILATHPCTIARTFARNLLRR